MQDVCEHDLVKAHVVKLVAHVDNVLPKLGIIRVEPCALVVGIVAAKLGTQADGRTAGRIQRVTADVYLRDEVDVLILAGFQPRDKLRYLTGLLRLDIEAVIHRGLRLRVPHEVAAHGLHLQHERVADAETVGVFVELVLRDVLA